MKTLYIICDLYPPTFAPRVAYLTKYIQEFGWTPYIFSEKVDRHQVFSDFATTCWSKQFALVPQSPLKKKLAQMGELFFQRKESLMYRAIKETLKEEDLPSPDAVLCLTFNKFPLQTALKLAKEWNVPMLADCRDIIEQYSRGDFLPKRIKFFGRNLAFVEHLIERLSLDHRNRCLKEANAVTTVSSWHKSVLEQINPRTSVIYNGYDEELFYPKRQKAEQFQIVYTGRLLSLAMRNPELLFRALQRDELKSLDIVLNFYTDTYSAQLLKEKEWAKNESRLQIKPMVPSSEVPDILNQASLILLLANDESKADSPKGMLTTKLFEALAVRKPCLLLPTTTGEAVSILKQTKSGIASNEVDELVEFIYKAYQEWQANGFTDLDDEPEALKPYSRRRQAEEFANTLDTIL